MNKRLSVAVAAAALSVSMAIPAMAQWNQLGTNSWQWIENGAAVKDRWVTTENGQYYINLDGVASYNWINWNGAWYFGEQGANLGNVLKNTWASIDGAAYHFDANGVMAVGTQTIDGAVYTFAENGHCSVTPAGITLIYSTTGGNTNTTTTTHTVSGGGGGGGSSSGGGGGSTTKPTEQAKTVQTEINGARDAIAEAINDDEAFSNASVNYASANGNMVYVTAKADVDKTAQAAEAFTSVIQTVIGQSDLADEIESIELNSVTATDLFDLEEKAQNILGEMSVEVAVKMFENKRAVVTLKDGTKVRVTVNYTLV
ncbi:MAG: hypothetical protein Q4C63_01800 [Eubacteriales bacterium]|nr:hypothetical protein [Eubacteriales bacterium]